MVVAKDLRIAYLLDFYGDMLTGTQREVLDAYYNEDLSLAEIAQDRDITRQGVRDAIKRAEQQLLEMEDRLGLARRFSLPQATSTTPGRRCSVSKKGISKNSVSASTIRPAVQQ